jgi:hypothetical protein
MPLFYGLCPESQLGEPTREFICKVDTWEKNNLFNEIVHYSLVGKKKI